MNEENYNGVVILFRKNNGKERLSRSGKFFKLSQLLSIAVFVLVGKVVIFLQKKEINGLARK